MSTTVQLKLTNSLLAIQNDIIAIERAKREIARAELSRKKLADYLMASGMFTKEQLETAIFLAESEVYQQLKAGDTSYINVL